MNNDMAQACDAAAAVDGGRQIGEVILDLQNISLSFGGVKALTDISFNVREHEIRSIIGPNGAGKSSMLNVINGVYHPSYIDFFEEVLADSTDPEVIEAKYEKRYAEDEWYRHQIGRAHV